MRESTRIYMATSNAHKLSEAREILSRFAVGVSTLNTKGIEIQADDIKDVAVAAIKQLVKTARKPVFVEDSGLSIMELKDFPGPYSNYFFRTIGAEGILRLLAGSLDRRAEFRSVVVYGEPSGLFRLFTGRVAGHISTEVRGRGGFGFDPIFISHGSEKTFAEISLRKKNSYSHRGEAITKLGEWLASRM